MGLFQSSNRGLVEINEIGIDHEKTIQNLIQKNLNSIFPNLEFIATEVQLGHFRLDTIAFDKVKKSFVIIEYKKTKNQLLTDQGRSYYNKLLQYKEKIVVLYYRKKKQFLDVSAINWSATKVILISPQYTKFQEEANNDQSPLEYYQIRKYRQGAATFYLIENFFKKQKDSSSKENKKSKTRPIIVEYNEDEYLHQTTSSATKRLWSALKNRIEETFDDVEFHQKKYYAGYYLKDKGSAVCTLEAQKRQIKLRYSTPDGNLIIPSKFVKNTSGKGYWGLGIYLSLVQSLEDIEKAIPLIRKVYQSKKEKKSQMR